MKNRLQFIYQSPAISLLHENQNKLQNLREREIICHQRRQKKQNQENPAGIQGKRNSEITPKGNEQNRTFQLLEIDSPRSMRNLGENESDQIKEEDAQNFSILENGFHSEKVQFFGNATLPDFQQIARFYDYKSDQYSTNSTPLKAPQYSNQGSNQKLFSLYQQEQLLFHSGAKNYTPQHNENRDLLQFLSQDDYQLHNSNMTPFNTGKFQNQNFFYPRNHNPNQHISHQQQQQQHLPNQNNFIGFRQQLNQDAQFENEQVHNYLQSQSVRNENCFNSYSPFNNKPSFMEEDSQCIKEGYVLQPNLYEIINFTNHGNLSHQLNQVHHNQQQHQLQNQLNFNRNEGFSHLSKPQLPLVLNNSHQSSINSNSNIDSNQSKIFKNSAAVPFADEEHFSKLTLPNTHIENGVIFGNNMMPVPQIHNKLFESLVNTEFKKSNIANSNTSQLENQNSKSRLVVPPADQFKQNSAQMEQQQESGTPDDNRHEVQEKYKRENDIEQQNELNDKLGNNNTPAANFIGCNCQQSKCLKLYCECFALQEYCSQQCNCVECGNRRGNEQARRQAKEEAIARNQDAFLPKSQQISLFDPNNPGKKGCSCKKTHCQKKYCECFNSGVPCNEFCKCDGCENTHHHHPIEEDGVQNGEKDEYIELQTPLEIQQKKKKKNLIFEEQSTGSGSSSNQNSGEEKQKRIYIQKKDKLSENTNEKSSHFCEPSIAIHGNPTHKHNQNLEEININISQLMQKQSQASEDSIIHKLDMVAQSQKPIKRSVYQKSEEAFS